MNRVLHKGAILQAFTWALTGWLATATMLWLILTDAVMTVGLWPADIHQALISAIGGTTVADPTGIVRTELPWLLLVLWPGGLMIPVIGVSLLWHLFTERRPARDSPVPHSPGQGSRGTALLLVRVIGRTGMAGCLGLPWLVVWLCAELWPDGGAAQLLYLAPGLWLAVVLSSLLCAATSGRQTFRGFMHREVGSLGVGERLLTKSTELHEPDGQQVLPVAGVHGWFCNRWFVVLSVGMLAWIAVSFWMNERLYAGLWIPHGDSAMYEEHLWNISHGKGFRSYLDQGLFLGEHLQVIHLLLLPVHLLWPSLLMMELAESIALGVCVIPIYSMTLRYSGSRSAAAWLGLTWLLYFPMHFLDIAIDLKTLRPSCYGLPFLFWGIDLAERRRLWVASVCFLVALSAQEDFALVIGSIGGVLWWNGWRASADTPSGRSSVFQWWSLGVTVFCVVYVLAAVLVVIPWFRSGVPVHYSRYFGDLGNSPGDLIRTTLRDPLRVLQQFLTWRTVLYVLVFAVPLGCLMLRSPVRLLAGAVTFVMLSLMQLGNHGSVVDAAVQPIAQGTIRDAMAGTDGVAGGGAAASGVAASGVAGGDSRSVSHFTADLPPVPYHHFHAPLLPVLFWAAAAGLRRKQPPVGKVVSRHRGLWTELRHRWNDIPPQTAARFACLCALFSAVTGSMMPMGVGFWSDLSRTGYSRLFVPGPRAEQFAALSPQLPLTARIASTDYVHTRLTHYERSYDYSDYLRAVNHYQPGVPADTDLIVIDTQHPYSSIQRPEQVPELIREPDQWRVWEDTTDGYFIVLERVRVADRPE